VSDLVSSVISGGAIGVVLLYLSKVARREICWHAWSNWTSFTDGSETKTVHPLGVVTTKVVVVAMQERSCKRCNFLQRREVSA
jgi:hypothetical protein